MSIIAREIRLRRRLFVPHNEEQRRIVSDFSALYYNAPQQTWTATFWHGVVVRKPPTDLWIYQEIIHRQRPKTIIETGTFCGGSALFMAEIAQIFGLDTRVITIDIAPQCIPSHPRIAPLRGSSTDPDIIKCVEDLVEPPVMVVLDSNHAYEHVKGEIAAYSPMVTQGQYMIVEDTNLCEAGIERVSDGPRRAVDEFLATDPPFRVVRDCEKFMLTQNRSGFLLRC